jgi:hypothetical protein
MEKSNTVTQEELQSAAAGVIPHWLEELQRRQKAYLRSYTVVGHHTQMNGTRLPKEGQKPTEVHGSKIGAKFSRRITGLGQPFNGDLIPGQLVLRKLIKDKTKYNPDGSLKTKAA